MRVPKFLIRFHQRVKGTRTWQHRWKIVAVAPFVLALGVFSYYTIYRILAENQHRDFVTEWEAKGETLDIDTLYPVRPKAELDFFKHPAVVKELDKHYSQELSRIHAMGIKGITENSNAYGNASGKGTFAMGVPVEIQLWIDPAEPGLTDTQAAQQCLRLIAPFNKRLDAIIEASRRPIAFHERGFDEKGAVTRAGAGMNALSLYGPAKLLSDRIILRLNAGDTTAAVEDMHGYFRTVHHIRKGHSLIGYLVGSAMIRTMERPLWEGLRLHLWSDITLAGFEKELASVNEHRRFLNNMRQEIAYTNLVLKSLHEDPDFLEKQFRSLAGPGSTTPKTWKKRGEDALEAIKPRGWYLKQGTRQIKILTEEIFYPGGSPCTKLTIEQARRLETIPDPLAQSDFGSWLTSQETMDMYARQIIKALHTQASINNMRTAIALERYRLNHGDYPATLNHLVPHFLPAVLEDVISGGPLQYRIKPDGTPLIYSVGADEKDDGGRPHRYPEQGDWAWMYSPPKGFTWSDYRKR